MSLKMVYIVDEDPDFNIFNNNERALTIIKSIVTLSGVKGMKITYHHDQDNVGTDIY